MLNANEARAASEENRRKIDWQTAQAKDLVALINKAIEEGKFATKYYYKLTDESISNLQDLGYRLVDNTNPESLDCWKISW